MSFNLPASIRSFFPNEVISKVASSLGEDEAGITKALNSAIPVILVGVLRKTGTFEGASDLLGMAKETVGAGELGNLGFLLGRNNGNLVDKSIEKVKGLFGNRLAGIINLISSHAGIKQSSVTSLLGMVVPVALGVLGKHATENNLNASGLADFLVGQSDSIMSTMPPELSYFSSTLGLDSITNKPQGRNADLKFLVPLFVTLLLVAAGLYFFKGRGENNKLAINTGALDTTTGKIDTVTAAVIPPSGRESIKVKLPNGAVLIGFKKGIEENLVSFLGTDYAKLGPDSLKQIWFDFDKLNFSSGSAQLTPESQVQVDNIAAILKAYPFVKLKIGGYADKRGNEENNKKLSDARAKAVKNSLNRAGVASQITGTEGYGSYMAKYPANAPEINRIKDRHVAVSVRL